MAKIWAERVLASTRKFEKVPASFKSAVEKILKAKFDNGEITEEELQKALGGGANAAVR